MFFKIEKYFLCFKNDLVDFPVRYLVFSASALTNASFFCILLFLFKLRLKMQSDAKQFYLTMQTRMSSLFKLSCHIPFTHASTAMRYGFKFQNAVRNGTSVATTFCCVLCNIELYRQNFYFTVFYKRNNLIFDTF